MLAYRRIPGRRSALRSLVVALGLAALSAGAPVVAAGAAGPEGPARLLRYPDIHRDFVVFVHAGDLWRAPVAGGTARRLTAHAGQELFPQISPDGSQVAFTAEYTGSRQVFVMPASGGPSRQLTFQNDVGPMPPRGGFDNWILGWTPEGKILVRMNRTPWGERMGRYFTVDPAGGLERPLALPEGGGASLSPDGKRIAYCPISREFRTWKRTRGGRAQDIWIYDLERHISTPVTDDRATDNFPMWIGQTIYFTSDRDGTLNLYAHELTSGTERSITSFDEFDVLWPSAGPESIVFMNGGRLLRFDVARGTVSTLAIDIASDMPLAAARFEDVSDEVSGADLSPSGTRVVLEARGELFSVPAEHGATRNLTRTPGIREIDPAWSPDGEHIAYLSDASGEYEVWIRDQNGQGQPRRLTSDGDVWLFAPIWSPDSKNLAFSDRKRRLRIVGVADGSVTEVDRGRREDLSDYVWSPDGRWLAYETDHPTRMRGIALYSLDQKRAMLLGDGLTEDYEPTFSSDGQYLFFLSDRDYNLTFSSFEFNYVYNRAGRVYVAALDPSAPALFPLRSDEEPAAPGKAADDDRKPAKKSRPGKKKGASEDESESEKPAAAPTRVVPEGWVARTVGLPGLSAGAYRSLSAAEGGVFYIRGAGPDDPPSLYRYDLADREEAAVLDGVGAYGLSADGKKLLFTSAGAWGIVDAQAGQSRDKGRLDLSGLRVKLEPTLEWAQMYRDAWRISRDWFYDPEMHGKDWTALGRRYEALLPWVAHRADLDFVLGELISELDAGHTYVQSGDEPQIERVAGATLGCELEPDDRGYRIARIFAGENWDETYRSPLTEPGVDIAPGEYLLAIDGVPLSLSDNPYRLLEGKAGTQVMLRVGRTPEFAEGRDVTVRPRSGDGDLRYIDWVKQRMRLADELSGGRVGYIHLPNTAIEGNRMLQKLFYSQVSKPALIVDDRYNGGGFIPDRMIEYFSRRTLAYWARRDVESMRTPSFAHDGPKVMLINGYSSSGGDALPYFFRKNDLGPLIGTRTWGGLIGLTGNPSLMDGGTVLLPTFRIYDTEGHWVVENEGVEPDIEILDLPELRRQGHDPSLEKGVEVLLEALADAAPAEPGRPVPPDLGGGRR